MGSKSRKRRKRSKCLNLTFGKKAHGGTIEFDNSADKAKPNGCMTVVTRIGVLLIAICLILSFVYIK